MFARRSLILILIFFQISAASITAAVKDKGPDEYRPEKILGFTKYLIANKEYYRAYVELNRLSAYYPGYLNPSSLYTSENYLLFKGRRYKEIINKKSILNDPKTACIGRIFMIDAQLHLNNYIAAKGMLGPDIDCSAEINTFLWKRRLISHLLLNEPDKAFDMIHGIPANSDIDKKRFGEIIADSKERSKSLVNPYYSLFAGVIPGMGYVHAGNRPTGIVAFIAISIFSAVTYFAFKTDNKPIGVLAGSATAFFYTGSILGGYLTAKKNNKQTMDNLRDFLFEDMNLEKDRDRIFNDYGLRR